MSIESLSRDTALVFRHRVNRNHVDQMAVTALLLRAYYRLTTSLTCYLRSMGKPSGLRAGRKLETRRRTQKWADKSYNKAHIGSVFKSNPFGGSSHAKGIVIEKV